MKTSVLSCFVCISAWSAATNPAVLLQAVEAARTAIGFPLTQFNNSSHLVRTAVSGGNQN